MQSGYQVPMPRFTYNTCIARMYSMLATQTDMQLSIERMKHNFGMTF